ncbi:MAG: hypothetical protein JHC93_05880 [Parachlamydiales bacterium]|nr:hypothetical protein [Parachlamydiales bacterium]
MANLPPIKSSSFEPDQCSSQYPLQENMITFNDLFTMYNEQISSLNQHCHDTQYILESERVRHQEEIKTLKEQHAKEILFLREQQEKEIQEQNNFITNLYKYYVKDH